MIAYDFDKTIYDGDSSFDFYWYCFKKKKKICKYWGKQILYFFLYLIHKKNKTEMKEVFFCFLKDLDGEKMVKEFWETHDYKIKVWYLKKEHNKDIIISASPEFLLKVPCQKLNVPLIGSDVDIKTGKFLKANCHGQEKVRRLKEQYPNVEIEEMYTDSLVDLPMIEFSKHGFIVDKDKIIPYQKKA